MVPTFKTQHSCETVGTTHPTAQHHTLENLNLQKQRTSNLTQMTKVSLLTKEFMATANKSSRTGNMLLSAEVTRVTPNWLTNTVSIWQSCSSAIFLALILPSLNLLRITAFHIDNLVLRSSGFSEDWTATFWKQYVHSTCARNIIITKSTHHKLCNFMRIVKSVNVPKVPCCKHVTRECRCSATHF